MIMLLNPYPRVRRYTAEQLYIKLAEHGEMFADERESIEKANQLLANTVWHEEYDSRGELVVCRNRIADILGILLTDDQRRTTFRKKVGSRSSPKDEFECYSSLVQMG
jgi:hypothetical protein